MNLELICFILGIMLIPFTFLFFPKIFYNKEFYKYFIIITVLLALIGILSSFENQNFYVFLVTPLYSYSIFRLELYIFRKLLNRNPIDPPRNFFLEDDGLGWDRFFYFMFMILSLCFPILMLANK